MVMLKGGCAREGASTAIRCAGAAPHVIQSAAVNSSSASEPVTGRDAS